MAEQRAGLLLVCHKALPQLICGTSGRSWSKALPPPLPPPAGLGPLGALHLAAGITTAALLPLLFVELRRLGPLSGAGVAATGLVLGMVLSLLALDPHRAALPQQVRCGCAFAALLRCALLDVRLCTAHRPHAAAELTSAAAALPPVASSPSHPPLTPRSRRPAITCPAPACCSL